MTVHVAEPKLFKLRMDRISHLQGRRIILWVDELKREKSRFFLES